MAAHALSRPDDRRAVRMTLDAPGTLRLPGRAVDARLVDLSRFGCRAESAEPPLVGEAMVIAAGGVRLGGAVVIWADERAFGLAFDRPASAADLRGVRAGCAVGPGAPLAQPARRARPSDDLGAAIGIAALAAVTLLTGFVAAVLTPLA